MGTRQLDPEPDKRLRDLALPSSLDTSQHDLPRDFFNPLLELSDEYLRGVGYFTSGWLRENAVGLSHLAENGGHARMIVSPILVDDDWQAISLGAKAKHDDRLYDALARTVRDLETELTHHQRNALAWLIADGVIEFRLAFPRNRLSGEFHDKFGIFKDALGDAVSFNGSYNDTEKGLRNYESIKVFKSWSNATEEWVRADEQRFERLWTNSDPNVEVVGFPEAIKRSIATYRVDTRPYVPSSTNTGKIDTLLPTVPETLTLRDYQEEAVRAWFGNRGRGILKMATGTGKTATALFLVTTLSRTLSSNRKALTAIVICPYRHLVDQWIEAAHEFGIVARRCYEDRARWWKKVSQDIATWGFQKRGLLLLVTTNATFRTEHFSEIVTRVSTELIVIGDEVHNLGSMQLKETLPMNAKFRLGLSATPERFRDEEGTEAIESYFGKTVFEFGLSDAIRNGFLTRYEYYPVLVPLNEEEEQEYLELTAKIGRRIAAITSSSEEDPALEGLLLRRARLLGAAANKIAALEEQVRGCEQTSHCLFYCGDGSVNSSTSDVEQRQIDLVTHMLGNKLGLKVNQYTAETSGAERQRLLKQLGSGKLDGLIAIRCLDEGVDVPEVRNAFIMASSTNPREFVQRRGRVLRTAPGKDVARIWDFLVQPPQIDKSSPNFAIERRLLQRELGRAVKFAELAENGPQARRRLSSLMKTYDLLDV